MRYTMCKAPATVVLTLSRAFVTVDLSASRFDGGAPASAGKDGVEA